MRQCEAAEKAQLMSMFVVIPFWPYAPHVFRLQESPSEAGHCHFLLAWYMPNSNSLVLECLLIRSIAWQQQ